MKKMMGLAKCFLMVFVSMNTIPLYADDSGMPDDIPKIELEYLTQIQFAGPNMADLEPLSYKGKTMVGRIMGGAASGPVLNGEILPAGEDWALHRPDGTLEIDVRALLRTEDGALIKVSWQAIWHGSKEVKERILAGEDVDPKEYYLRGTPRFETTSPKYAWLNNIVAIGYGKVLGGAGVNMKIFQVK